VDADAIAANRTDAQPAPAQGAEPQEPPAGPMRADAPAAPEAGHAAVAEPTAPRGSTLAQAPAIVAVPQRLDPPSPIQQSIARIQEACQAPPLAPQEYRLLFEIMAKEINAHDLLGVETLNNIARQAQEHGIELRRDDIRFVLEVVSEADPWFEQGATADLFAARFRTFVVARCRGQGLNLSADELHLIDAWFLGTGMSAWPASRGSLRVTPALAAPQAVAADGRDGRWWTADDARVHKPGLREVSAGSQGGDQGAGSSLADDTPRIMRTRLHG
jgi:hypothetical protein